MESFTSQLYSDIKSPPQRLYFVGNCHAQIYYTRLRTGGSTSRLHHN